MLLCGTRKLDSVGRFVIPKEIYNTLGIAIGDSLEISLVEIFSEGQVIKAISLIKKEDACLVCGSKENDFIQFKEKSVCNDCISIIKGF